MIKRKVYLVLDNIRSAQNVGSIFRTADAVGVVKIYLCGITPKPPRKDIDKSALGAVDFVEWEYVESARQKAESLKQEGVGIIALEQDKRSLPYAQLATSDKPLALVVGSEIDGVSSEILDIADKIIEIPMNGQKNSLNVSVATGIALYKIIEN